MAAKIYPEARRALIAQGRPEAEVDAMPVIQAASLYGMQKYQKYRDDLYKWMNVPYWQSIDKVDRSILNSVEDKLSNPIFTMFWMLTPALSAVRQAQVRVERKLDALQCIEGIRLYASSHDGKFPPNLDALADSPAPIDPATGKPFSYAVNGDSAILTGPTPPGWPDHPTSTIRYQLKMSK